MNAARFMALLLAMLTVTAGCGTGPRSRPPEELNRAEEALKSSLEAWKKGESAEQWKKKEPTISMTDPDWKLGAKLLGFEIKKTEGSQDQNMRVWTVLSIQSRQGKKSQPEVVYEVNSAKGIIIARDPFN